MGEKWVPTESFRAEAPGQFAALSHGRTHYLLHVAAEPPTAERPLIVCVHGINAELAIWAHFDQHFVALGRSVLSFDLYGRGYSDGVDKPNDLALFLGQLAELLGHPDVAGRVPTAKIDLVGSSLGGAIAAAFSARFPDRVRRCVLMAPAGLGLPSFGHLLQRVFRVPFLGKAALSLANSARGIETNMQQSFGNPTHPAVVAFIATAAARVKHIADHHPGYVPSFVSTVGHFPLDRLQDDFRTLGAGPVPFLVVWGDKDTVVNYERDVVTLRALVPAAQVFVLEGGGHIDHFVIPEYADKMYAKVGEFLQS